jgi:hypothetical protein
MQTMTIVRWFLLCLAVSLTGFGLSLALRRCMDSVTDQVFVPASGHRPPRPDLSLGLGMIVEVDGRQHEMYQLDYEAEPTATHPYRWPPGPFGPVLLTGGCRPFPPERTKYVGLVMEPLDRGS